MRFNSLCAATLGLVALTAAGCASAGANPESVASQAAAGKLGPAFLEWSGNFRSTLHQSGEGYGVRGRNQATGSVRLTAPNVSQTRVQITLSVPSITDPVRTHWAVSPGACRANSIPLMAVAAFPEISLSNSSGQLDEIISMTMPTSGSLHVDVYFPGASGQDQSEVLTCAELTIGQRSN